MQTTKNQGEPHGPGGGIYHSLTHNNFKNMLQFLYLSHKKIFVAQNNCQIIPHLKILSHFIIISLRRKEYKYVFFSYKDSR